jgi:hypothetical protein
MSADFELARGREILSAMSQQNVERLRAFLEPWGREPWTPEAWERGEVIDMSVLDPNVVYEDENLVGSDRDRRKNPPACHSDSTV